MRFRRLVPAQRKPNQHDQNRVPLSMPEQKIGSLATINAACCRQSTSAQICSFQFTFCAEYAAINTPRLPTRDVSENRNREPLPPKATGEGMCLRRFNTDGFGTQTVLECKLQIDDVMAFRMRYHPSPAILDASCHCATIQFGTANWHIQ